MQWNSPWEGGVSPLAVVLGCWSLGGRGERGQCSFHGMKLVIEGFLHAVADYFNIYGLV